MSISEDILATIEQGRPTADKKFKAWLDDLPEGEKENIDKSLVNGDISVLKLFEVLKSHGAPLSQARLYDYKNQITSKRVKG